MDRIFSVRRIYEKSFDWGIPHIRATYPFCDHLVSKATTSYENDCIKNKRGKKEKMEGNGEEVFIAEGREERVHYSKSYVIKKKHLRMASLLGKIVTKTSNPADPAIEELGADDAAEHNVDHQDFSKGEFKCPFLHLGFTIQRGNCSKKGKELGSDDEENTFYTDEIVFAKQEVVSRSLISNKLVAAQYHKSSRVDYPDPLPLSSSLASFEDRKWNKFGIQKQVLPRSLISDCLQSVISMDQ